MHYHFKNLEDTLFEKLKQTKLKHNFKDNLRMKLKEEINELTLATLVCKHSLPSMINREEMYKEIADVYIVLKQLGVNPTERLLGAHAYESYTEYIKTDMVSSATIYKLTRTIERIEGGYYG